MANDLNQCNFIGRLGRDPEVRYMPSGDAVANFSLAVGESWKDKSGEKQEHTEWVRCSAFGKLAEICGEYLKKGKQCFVSGSLKTRKYTDKDGSEKFSTEVKVDRMQLLGGRDEAEKPAPAKAPSRFNMRGGVTGNVHAKPAAQATGFDDMEDDIPFATSSMHYDMTTSKERRMQRYGR